MGMSENLNDFEDLKPLLVLDSKNKQWFLDMMKLVRKFLTAMIKLLSINIDE